MTKTTTLFMALFMALSSMAQNAIVKSNLSHSPIQNSSEQTPETKSGFDLFTANKNRTLQQLALQHKSKMARVATSTVTKQRLDSVVQQQMDNTNKLVNYTKDEYTYDVASNMSIVISYSWSGSSNHWVGNKKEEYAFDEKNNKTMFAIYNWDSTTNKWVGSEKNEYSFDALGNTTKDVGYSWKLDSNQWQNKYKYDYTYDKSDSIVESFYSDWDTTKAVWDIKYNTEYTNDDNGNKTLSIMYQWNSNYKQWFALYKDVYTNDVKGNNILWVDSTWNNKWELSYKEENNYDDLGNNTLFASYHWTNQWIGSSKYEYAYDMKGNMKLKIYSNWNTSTHQWQNNLKIEYAYDANGNSTENFIYIWNTTSNLWGPIIKTSTLFDNSYLVSDIISGGILSSDTNMPTYMYIYNFDGIDWNLSKKGQVYYSTQDIQSATKTVLSDAINVYPNPASSYVTFNVEKAAGQYTFQLSDLQGKIIINQSIQNNARLSVESVPKGLYLYKITASDKTYNGKLMVKYGAD